MVLTIVLGIVAMSALTQPAYRRMQWVMFGERVQELDRVARERGWKIVAVTFNAGWLIGKGEIRWRRGDEMWTSRCTIAPGTRPW